MRIDHIMVGSNDLRGGMAELERMTGVRPVIGGVHPGQGTRNALISIGPRTYLEIYAPNPADMSKSSDAASLKRLKRLTPIGWAVSADDMAVLRDHAALSGLELTEPEPGSRRLPNGTLLRWSAFGYANFGDPRAPFFIHWNDQRLHPSRTSPIGCHLIELRLDDPTAAKLRLAVDPLKIPVTIRASSTPRMTVRLRCPRGLVTIG
jgi:hypothetical protein